VDDISYQYKGQVPATKTTQVIELKIYEDGLKYAQTEPGPLEKCKLQGNVCNELETTELDSSAAQSLEENQTRRNSQESVVIRP
jgi:sRNA-binding protein